MAKISISRGKLAIFRGKNRLFGRQNLDSPSDTSLVLSFFSSGLEKTREPSELESMSELLNFAEILEKQLRQQSRTKLVPERPSQTSSSSEPLMHSELWTHFVGKIAPQHFKTSQQARVYHRLRPNPQIRPAHALTLEQAQALQFFQAYGSDLADNFTAKELKSAFRKLALKLHPDQGGQNEDFFSLKKAFQCLQRVGH